MSVNFSSGIVVAEKLPAKLTQPDGDLVHGEADTVGAVGGDDVCDDVGHPAQDEGAQDDAQLTGGLLLLPQPRVLLASQRISVAGGGRHRRGHTPTLVAKLIRRHRDRIGPCPAEVVEVARETKRLAKRIHRPSGDATLLRQADLLRWVVDVEGARLRARRQVRVGRHSVLHNSVAIVEHLVGRNLGGLVGFDFFVLLRVIYLRHNITTATDLVTEQLGHGTSTH